MNLSSLEHCGLCMRSKESFSSRFRRPAGQPWVRERYIGTIWLAITFPPVSRAARADFQNDIADSPLLPGIRPHPPRDSIPVAAGRQRE
ncbi:unnamed protein product [Arctogadus glacialis]